MSATDPRRRIIEEARRVQVAAQRVGFSVVAQKRLRQAIEWMELETPAVGAGEACGQTDEHCRHGQRWDDHCEGCGRIMGSLGMSGA